VFGLDDQFIKIKMNDFERKKHKVKFLYICYWIKYVFGNFKLILKLVYFETSDKFNPFSFEIHKFSSFNQILLSLFDISSASYYCI